jgi:hypothetical protein
LESLTVFSQRFRLPRVGRGGITGVAWVDFHGYRATFGGGQHSVFDLLLALLAIAILAEFG